MTTAAGLRILVTTYVLIGTWMANDIMEECVADDTLFPPRPFWRDFVGHMSGAMVIALFWLPSMLALGASRRDD